MPLHSRTVKYAMRAKIICSYLEFGFASLLFSFSEPNYNSFNVQISFRYSFGSLFISPFKMSSLTRTSSVVSVMYIMFIYLLRSVLQGNTEQRKDSSNVKDVPHWSSAD